MDITIRYTPLSNEVSASSMWARRADTSTEFTVDRTEQTSTGLPARGSEIRQKREGATACTIYIV